MDIQILIVGIIILLACLYVGKMIYAKIKATISKKSCGSDCGCSSSPKNSLPIQIKRN